MKIAILGFGREGQAILKFLKKSPQFKKSEVEIRDQKFDENYLKGLNQFDVIFRSPGIPYTCPEIQLAKKSGAKISSATELFFELNSPTPGVAATPGVSSPLIIGITGTKGKSTTSTLIYEILKKSGKDVYLAGNIGKPALDLIPRLSALSQRNSASTFIVLELSSFQLQALKHSPNVAVVLGLFPDHMDAHKSFKEYVEAKSNITAWQKKSDVVFYAPENKYATAIAEKSSGKKVASNSLLAYSRELENKIRELIHIPGEHQFKNALMAAAVCKYLGVQEKSTLKTISRFRGLPHRLEFIRKTTIKPKYVSSHVLPSSRAELTTGRGKNVRINCYVNFYNDSAATNPHTAAAAINSFKNPVILLAGGKDKNLDYKPLGQALKKSSVKYVVLYGENKNKIEKAIFRYRLLGAGYRVIKCKNLKEAVKIACKNAKRLLNVKGQMSEVKCATVLLSPASASFDQFKDYKERGDVFKKLVKKLKV